MNDHTPVYRRRLNEPGALGSLLRFGIERALRRFSREHLKAGRRQVVGFVFDNIAHRINLYGLYERDELETLIGWIRSNRPEVLDGVALDVGANIGNHSLFLADHFRAVIAFEPNRRTYRVLELNASLVNNIECLNIGLSDSSRYAMLETESTNVGAAHVVPDAGHDESRKIELRRLDEVLQGPGRVTMIKVDVEGHELEALHGARRIIAEHAPIVLFEQHPSDFREGGSRVIDFLRSQGYDEFLTVTRHPRISTRVPGALRYPLLLAARLVSGQSMRVQPATHFLPGFYPFIVAVPQSRRQHN